MSYSSFFEELKTQIDHVQDFLLEPENAEIDHEEPPFSLFPLGELRNILFDFRAPHFAFVGSNTIATHTLLEEWIAPTYLTDQAQLDVGWNAYGSGIRTLDLRNSHPDESLNEYQPDLVFCTLKSTKDISYFVHLCQALCEESEDMLNHRVDCIFLIDSKTGSKRFYNIRRALYKSFEELGLSKQWARIESIQNPSRVSKTILETLPSATQLSFARMCSDDVVKTLTIKEIISLAAATNAALGSMPLPVADFIPITTVQSLMILGIAYIGGNDIETKVLRKFLMSLGISVGIGLAFRELVRALSQLLPLAGPLVSATIASSVTKNLGSAATRYFIEK